MEMSSIRSHNVVFSQKEMLHMRNFIHTMMQMPTYPERITREDTSAALAFLDATNTYNNG